MRLRARRRPGARRAIWRCLHLAGSRRWCFRGGAGLRAHNYLYTRKRVLQSPPNHSTSCSSASGLKCISCDVVVAAYGMRVRRGILCAVGRSEAPRGEHTGLG
eukprot:2308112-Prymnesium_polylepis.1